jgi:isoquinoline 1-oxidoreductase subunit beta
MGTLASTDTALGSLSRRGFFVVSTAAGLAFGIPVPVHAANDPAAKGGLPPIPEGPIFEPTLWFTVDGTGMVTIHVIRAEMGQHVGTALARILADELEVQWDKVRILHVDSDPKWGTMVTGGSWSVWQSFPPFSRAGAAGRLALIEQGARLLEVEPAACTARDGIVSAGTKSISYGEIVKKGALDRRFSPEELATLPIKPVAERRLIGQPVTALDVPNKINGGAVYGIDAKVPGMVYARPILPPTRNGSAVVSVDDSAARTVKGYLKTITLDDPSNTVPGWVMVIAESYPAAYRAAERVKVTWKAGPTAKVSEADLQAHGAALIAKTGGGSIVETGGGDTAAALKAAKPRLMPPIPPRPCCISRSNPSTRSRLKRMACLKSTPATSGRASCCRPSPKHWHAPKPPPSR